MSFGKNVFINCPFDEDYKVLLKPLLFTLVFLDLNPQISQTISSSDVRIDQIKNFIRNSRFSIHDLSRCKPMKRNDLPRFNLPFELGLDIGSCEFGLKKFKNKRILILETERYQYQKVISDIAGQDIENHDDDPRTIVKKIRNWISSINIANTYPGPTIIWTAYNQFDADLKDNLRNNGYSMSDIKEIPVIDFIKFAKDWVKKFKKID